VDGCEYVAVHNNFWIPTPTPPNVQTGTKWGSIGTWRGSKCKSFYSSDARWNSFATLVFVKMIAVEKERFINMNMIECVLLLSSRTNSVAHREETTVLTVKCVCSVVFSKKSPRTKRYHGVYTTWWYTVRLLILHITPTISQTMS